MTNFREPSAAATVIELAASHRCAGRRRPTRSTGAVCWTQTSDQREDGPSDRPLTSTLANVRFDPLLAIDSSFVDQLKRWPVRESQAATEAMSCYTAGTAGRRCLKGWRAT